MKFSIKGRSIGEGEPCFIIAEAGVNHNGSLESAKRMIDAASEAGADAIKFQTFKTESVMSRDAEKADYQKETTGEGTQFDMVKKLELSESDFKILFDYARERNITCLSTPFDIESAKVLERLGVPAYKIASGEITNFPLLEHIASSGKPIIVSTGMATMKEISEAISILKENRAEEIILLHCITSYPAKMEELNLKVINTLATFGFPVGYSDHSLGIYAPIAAVALGACLVEKHFTLDRDLPGPDHRASLEPDELKNMVDAIRQVEKALGDGINKPTTEEEKIKLLVRKSIVAGVDITQGETITRDMLDVKRPGTGLHPKLLQVLVGKIARIGITKDSQIKMDDVE